MKDTVKIGIIFCERYYKSAIGKCFKAFREREGAFSIYGKNDDVSVVEYISCGGCPGGNIEFDPEYMKKSGAETIHLDTGFVIGYPPCPHLDFFERFIREKYDMKVIVGTHPIPQNYYTTHSKLGTWQGTKGESTIKLIISDEKTRKTYD